MRKAELPSTLRTPHSPLATVTMPRDHSRPRIQPLPLPLLITGVAGVAGYNAFHYFRQRYPGQVVAIRQEDNWPLTGDGIIPCNAEDHGRLRALFDEYQFRSVLNCAGNCALRACELDSRLAWRTNVEGLINLLSIIVERDVRLVHLSIDLVFSGDRPHFLTPRSTLRTPRLHANPTPPTPSPSTAKRWSPPSSSSPTGCRQPACCASRCRWASASTATPARSTGSNRASRKAGRPRSTSTKSARPRTPIASTASTSACWRATSAGLYHAGGPRALVALPDRANRQPRRRLRPEAAHGLPARRSRPDPAARRRRHDEFVGPSRGTRRRPARSLAARRVARSRPIATGTTTAARLPDRANSWLACCIAIHACSVALDSPAQVGKTGSPPLQVVGSVVRHRQLKSRFVNHLAADPPICHGKNQVRVPVREELVGRRNGGGQEGQVPELRPDRTCSGREGAGGGSTPAATKAASTATAKTKHPAPPSASPQPLPPAATNSIWDDDLEDEAGKDAVELGLPSVPAANAALKGRSGLVGETREPAVVAQLGRLSRLSRCRLARESHFANGQPAAGDAGVFSVRADLSVRWSYGIFWS